MYGRSYNWRTRKNVAVNSCVEFSLGELIINVASQRFERFGAFSIDVTKSSFREGND